MKRRKLRMDRNMYRLIELAQLIGSSISNRADLTLIAKDLEIEIANIRLEMTPEGGWDGKNAEQRDLAKALAELGHKELQARSKDFEGIKNEIMILDSLIAIYEAERRGLEWQIRDRMIDAFLLKNMQIENQEPIDNVIDNISTVTIVRELF